MNRIEPSGHDSCAGLVTIKVQLPLERCLQRRARRCAVGLRAAPATPCDGAKKDWDGKTLSTCAIGEMTRPKRLSSSQWKCMSRRDSAAYACVEFLKLLESICCRSYQKLSPPARSFTPTDYPFTSRYPNGATVTNAVSLLDRKALRTSRCLACTALPLCLRDGCWELTKGPSKRQLDYYLDEYTFRFNRRTSRSRGLLFYRLLEQAVATEPVTYRDIVTKNS